MTPYKPYKATKLETRIDNLVRLLSPAIAANRVLNREREHRFRYLSALPTSSRKNSNSQTSGETMRGSREKLQVMWNAINAVDNSGLCTSIVSKFQMYVCGTLRWQSRCGDRRIATEYEDYMKVATSKSLDITGRHSLRQMAMLDLRAILIKGDVGTNIVRDGSQLYLQGIEADRIGNPYDYKIANNYIRGLELDDAGRMTAARIFYRDRPTGTYRYEQTIPFRDERGMPRFLFLCNPISYDDYRGISVFKTAIDSATYIDRIREYELQALMWAASQSGVYHTTSGSLPEGLPFDRPSLVDASGNQIDTYTVRPNTVTALGVGEDVKMFQHDRPSPNVLGILESTVRDIAVGTGLSTGKVWDMSGYTGPAVRAINSQDDRAIEMWQQLLKENKLDPVALLLLGNAIAGGELSFHPNWMKWEWFFPAKSTIDVGRESDANIQEINAGINTGARVAANDGQDIEEIQIQRGREVEAMIGVAMEVAKNLGGGGETVDWREIYGLMCPRQGKGGQQMGGGGGAPPFGGGGNGARNGGKKETSRFYREDQARDDQGRFADEGRAGAPSGGAGTAVATVEKTETEAKPASSAREAPAAAAAPARQATDLDKAIADYKPDRALGDPAKTTPISKAVPGVSYTPYSQTPFFREVNILQGNKNPLEHGVADYIEQRQQLFETIPATKIKLDNVVATQEMVNTDRVQEIVNDPSTGGTKPIQIVKQDGKLYVLNGHHRVAALLAKGEHPEIDAHVLDLDHPEPAPPTSEDDVQRYGKELEQMPAYRTVVDRLKSLGASNGEREGYTLRQHIVPGSEIRDKDGYVVSGTFTPERQAEHEAIATKAFNPNAAAKEGQKPVAVLLMGKPAAGKSSAREKYVDQVFTDRQFTTINTDDLRAGLSDYRGWNAAATQAEAKIINGQLHDRALAARHNIVFDEVAGNTAKMTRKVEALGELGYEVHVVHVDAPLAQTSRISWERFKTSGRFVDPDYLLNDADNKPIITYNALKALPSVKSWKSVDNEGFKGMLTDEGSR